jgi:hypothetical protein
MRFTQTFTLLLSFMLVSTHAYAADGDGGAAAGGNNSGGAGNSGAELAVLKQIASNTFETVQSINRIPGYLQSITEMALSWLKTETEDSSLIMQTQADFATIGAAFSQPPTVQADRQVKAAANFLAQNPADFTDPVKANAVLTKMPYINNLFYSSVLGMKPVPKGAFAPGDYMQNALGTNIPHAVPDSSWQGDTLSKNVYTGYYKTIVAANSFGVYVLSNLITEATEQPQIATAQAELVKKASRSEWLAQVATQDLGKVLRDILVFQSQNYVMMTKLVELQKQTLVAQVMTNSLLIATNQGDEPKLLGQSVGLPQKSI